MATGDDGLSAEERQAVKDRAKELRAQAKAGKSREAGDAAAREAIAAMSGTDAEIASRLHEIIAEVAPSLVPKTWYGFPSYSDADGKVVVFFQPAEKFKTRYATLGFSDLAQLDDGELWPSAYAVTALTPDVERRIAELVVRAAG